MNKCNEKNWNERKVEDRLQYNFDGQKIEVAIYVRSW